MADTYSADIIIGGKIKRSDLETLFDAIADDGAWDETTSLPFDTDQDLETWEPEGELLRLYDPEAAWGHFDEIERVCQELGLPFVRWSEDGDKRVFDGQTAHDVTCDSDGYTVLRARKLRDFESREAAMKWLELMDDDPPPFEFLPEDEAPEGATFQAVVEVAYGAARQVGDDIDDPRVIRLIADWIDLTHPELKPDLLAWLPERIAVEKAERDGGADGQA